eukprot:TRINITY_DN1180_c0_g5_i1.p1 TRINITY_DN1180_c0_g5~~TRINITY_DN1180_c0_g5_i1.p1  ORF type:complete len:130 (+),score=34.46 TRINITY_DN1180_c0_g5_i1:393-782(+)
MVIVINVSCFSESSHHILPVLYESDRYEEISFTMAILASRSLENMYSMVPDLELSTTLLSIVVTWVLRSHGYSEASILYETISNLIIDEAIWHPIHEYLSKMSRITDIVSKRKQIKESKKHVFGKLGEL